MANEWAPSPPPKPKRRWPRRLAWAAAGCLLFLIVAYFVVTSFTFLKVFVLPRVNASINGTVKLSDARISAFSGVTLRGLRVEGAAFEEPLATVREVRVRHRLLEILKGNIHLQDVWLDSPIIQVVQYEDGTSNLERLLKPSSPKTTSQAASKSGPPPPIRLERLVLTNGLVRHIRQSPGGGRDTAELSNINISGANIGNGRTGNLQLGVGLKMDRAVAPSDTNAAGGLIEAGLVAGLDFALSRELQPESLRANVTFDVVKATRSFQKLGGMGATLDCDLTPDELKKLALSFSQGGKSLGRISVGGPLNLAKQEGDLQIDISSIDRQALNLAGAPLGLDFGSTTVNSAHHLILTNGGQFITATGKLKLNELMVTQNGATMKPLDLELDYNVLLNRPENWLLVQGFSLQGAQNRAPLLFGALARPMKLSFGNATNTAEDSAFNLTLTNFHLADWRAFLGDYDGDVQVALNVQSREAGRKLNVELVSRVQEFALQFGSNPPSRVDVALRVRSQLDEFQKARLEECRVDVSHQRQPIVTLAASGNYDLKSQGADLQSQLDLVLPGIARCLARPEINLSAGGIKLETRLIQQNLTPDRTNNPSLSQSVTARFRLEGLTGRFAEYRLDRFEAGFDLDANAKEALAELRKFSGFVKQAGQDGGTFDITGTYRLADKTVDGTLKLADLNQNVLRSLAAPALGDKELAKASISLQAAAKSNAKHETSVAAAVEMANLLIMDPAGKLPKVPLTAELKLDGVLREEVVEIRELTGKIQQGELPGGSLEVRGRYDTKQQVAKLALKLGDLNQNALRALLAPVLGDKTLESVSLGLEADANYDARGESSINGQLHLNRLLVQDPKGQFPTTPLETEVEFGGSLRGEEATLRQLAARVDLGGQPGGRLSVNGHYDLKKKSGLAKLKVTDLNENALRPVMGSALAGKTLASVSINADLNAGYDAEGKATLKGDLGVTKLLLLEPQSKSPGTPLAIDMRLDGSFAKQTVMLGQLDLKLSPTPRAKNQLSVTGRVDLAISNRIGGALVLMAESLDLTPYYESFRGPKSSTPPPTAPPKEKPPAGSPAAKPSGPSNAEPAAVELPFHDFIAGLNIGQLYLGEVAARDWRASIKLNGGRIDLKPFQLVLNGAPIEAKAELDLSRPGYRYDLNLSLDRLPVAPLVDTFAPEMRGQYKGNLITTVQVKGTGITGTNLRSNLTGGLSFSFTNADLKLASPKMKTFFTPIALLLGMPDLVNAPVSWVGAGASMGEGRINITRLDVVSESFLADTKGEIKIADVLNDSPIEKWPMHFHVRRAAAERLRLMPRNTPPDAPFVKLPDFVKVIGTIGEPKAELDKAALGSAVAEKLLDKAIPDKAKPGGLNPLDVLKKN